MTDSIPDSFTVLVVDDDPSVLATYGRLLRRSGYKTLTADDPGTLLDRGAVGADLLLLDYKMPGMDGLTLLRKLRQRDCRARCILISAFLDDEIRNRAVGLGVDHVMEKPVDVRTLRETIRNLLPADG